MPRGSSHVHERLPAGMHAVEIKHRNRCRPQARLDVGYTTWPTCGYLRGRKGGTSSVGITRMRKRSKCGTVNAAYPCCGV